MPTQRTDTNPKPLRTAGAQDTNDHEIAQPVIEAAIMTLLLSGGHEGPWTRAELELEVSASPLDVQDVLAALRGSGLLHMEGDLVIASRAARRIDELEL
jgi:hypothetical protein